MILFAGLGSARAQMTDDQIMEYISQATAVGKSEQQMGRELMARGVRISQLRELKGRMTREYGSAGLAQEADAGTVSRLRTGEAVGLNSLNVNQAFMTGTDAAMSAIAVDSIMIGELKPIYGHQIFTTPSLSFEPNENLSTPENYRLGPGDEIIIDIWGASETSLRRTISPEGDIMVSQIGPVYLSGLTIKEAGDKIRRNFANKYEGVSGDDPSSDIRVTLGQLRTIRVNVMGEVATPGTYRLSGFSSLFHALYNAGGVTNIGSLRNIKVMRNGKAVASADIYEYLFNGKLSTDIRLQEDDVIMVPPYSVLVGIEGEIKRPMYYEMKADETLADLVKYAGGFTGEAYAEELQVVRGTGRVHTLLTVPEARYAATRLEDGDVVSANAILDRFDNKVEIHGAVYREGMYELGDNISTVRRLVAAADGVKDDAFLGRALLTRKKDDFTFETIALDLEGILKGTTADVALMPDDELFVPSSNEIAERGDLTIRGMVANPGEYPYAENTTVEDLVLKAGGLLDGASLVQVEVARRNKDPRSTVETNSLGKIFVFDMQDGYAMNRGDNLILEPFDVVQIRRSPAYQPQRNVTIEGEVTFAGDYSLTHKGERLSDLIRRAGGVTADAYTHGARLVRKMNRDEIVLRDAMIEMSERKTGQDSIAMNTVNFSDTYTVGIELDKALENPGSDFDMVLREGDMLIVPETTSTVRINGAVMYPNTVLYQKGKALKYYVSQAGGYGYRAKRNKAYIIYMNGTVSRVNSRTGASKMEPGCEIVIPTKPERNGLKISEILSISTTAASLGVMAASIANIATRK